MKKVFLFLTASLFGVAAMAGAPVIINEEGENTVIQINYNSYSTSDTDGDGIADQWQGGSGFDENSEDYVEGWALKEIVDDQTGNSNWAPAIGEGFMVNMKGTSNISGKLQMFLVDGREVASWWSTAAPASAQVNLVAGEPFDISCVMIIDNIKFVTNNGNITEQEVEGGLLPGLVWGFFPTDGSASATWAGKTADFKKQVLELSLTEFDVIYAKAGDYEDPINMPYGGPADKAEDGYKYQAESSSTVASVKDGDYVNVKVSFTPTENISTLMYALVDISGSEWAKTTSDMISFASNLEKGTAYNFEFSAKLDNVAAIGTNPVFHNVFLAQSPDKALQVVLNKSSLEVTVGEKKYAEPVLDAVEEIAAEDAIVNGVIYAEKIVIYNAAGQVVANASESFEIATLPAGTYFALTEKGAFSFVK